jgi:hypothetical protein
MSVIDLKHIIEAEKTDYAKLEEMIQKEMVERMLRSIHGDELVDEWLNEGNEIKLVD